MHASLRTAVLVTTKRRKERPLDQLPPLSLSRQCKLVVGNRRRDKAQRRPEQREQALQTQSVAKVHAFPSSPPTYTTAEKYDIMSMSKCLSSFAFYLYWYSSL